jgi:Na+-driven multidrug efflux pump
VGLTLNRSIILLSMLSCITTFGWLFADSLFLRLGVDRGTCWYMSQYLRIRVFAIPAEICVLSYEKYLMSLGLMRPTMFSAFLYTVILAIAEAIGIFVYQSSIGVKGLAWVFVLCTYIEIIAMVSFSINHPYVQRTIIFPTAEAFTNLGDFFMLGLPGCVMVCAEW